MLTLTHPPKQTDADARLWSAASAGDDEARGELVERAWRSTEMRLRSFSADDREEIRQEIAKSVLHAVEIGHAPTSNLNAFLEWRGRAEVTAFIRLRIRQRQVTALDEIVHAAGSPDSPLVHASARELDAMVQDCSDRIPNDDHRSAWCDRYLEGLEPREIAVRRDANTTVVRAWISRAAKFVRACLRRKLATGGGDS